MYSSTHLFSMMVQYIVLIDRALRLCGMKRDGHCKIEVA